jgi:hypothetical protein
MWCDRIFTLASQTGASIRFCTNKETFESIKTYAKKKRYSTQIESQILADWDDFLVLSGTVEPNDLLIVITARKASLSYNPLLEKLPKQLANHFTQNSYIVLYPEQFKEGEVDKNIDSHKII